MSSSLTRLFQEYRSMLKAPELEEILDLVLFRPVAFVLVKLLQPTPITPNHVTLFSFLPGRAIPTSRVDLKGGSPARAYAALGFADCLPSSAVYLGGFVTPGRLIGPVRVRLRSTCALPSLFRGRMSIYRPSPGFPNSSPEATRGSAQG